MATLFPFLPPHLAPMDFPPFLFLGIAFQFLFRRPFAAGRKKGETPLHLEWRRKEEPLFSSSAHSLRSFSTLASSGPREVGKQSAFPLFPLLLSLIAAGFSPPPPPRSLTQTASALIGPVFFHLVASPSLSVHPRCHCCSGEEARGERGMMPFQCQRSTLETVPTSPSERVDFGNKTFPPPPLPLRRATMQRYAKGEGGRDRRTSAPSHFLPPPPPSGANGIEADSAGGGGGEKGERERRRPKKPLLVRGRTAGRTLAQEWVFVWAATIYIVPYGKQSPRQTTGSSSPPADSYYCPFFFHSNLFEFF